MASDRSSCTTEGDRKSELFHRFESVQAQLLACFPALVADVGGDTEAARVLQARYADLCSGQADMVSYRAVVDLLSTAAAMLECPDFGMRLAKRQSGAIESALLQVFLNCATLGEAVQEIVRHSYAHSLAAAIWFKSVPQEDCFLLGYDILIEGLGDHRQAIEQILLIEYLTWVEATRGAVKARRIDFRHQPVASPKEYRRHFGCEVRFEQPVDAIVFSHQVLKCPITTPDVGAYRRAINAVLGSMSDKEPPLKAAVRHAVVHRIWSNDCTNVAVAAFLDMHVRMMHRKLTDEGTSFQRIKNEVRRDFMVHYLDHTDLPIGLVSDRLGFVEQSAMTRFCRQWLKQSPSQRRRQG